MSDDCVQWSDHGAGLDAVVGPEQQERFVTPYRARHGNLFGPRLLDEPPAVTIHRQPVVDPVRGRAALLRTAETSADGGVPVGGVDLLTVRSGRIARAWPLTGTRPFRY
ncbi:hypothetical protein [Streptomyces sp. NPDC059918]|uniref:hypothetical protein n=1 Tax=unclassified Streptomyces TaxID=2593676 RepID=UPI003662C9F2